MWCSQGSIPGPRHFLLYINDLAPVCASCFCFLFADDSSMFISGPDVPAVHVMSDKLNSDIENIRLWLCCDKISLNVLKTHYMSFALKVGMWI